MKESFNIPTPESSMDTQSFAEDEAVLSNSALIYTYLEELDTNHVDTDPNKKRLRGDQVYQKLATAFARVQQYDEVFKHQNSIIESIYSSIDKLEQGTCPSIEDEIDKSEESAKSLAKSIAHRAFSLLKLIRSEEQLDWLYTEVEREYKIAIQNPSSAERYVSTLTFLHECPENLISKDIETIELVRNASQRIVQRVIDTNKEDLNVRLSLGENDDVTLLMKSINGLANAEFSRIDDVDEDLKKSKFVQLSKSIVNAIDENTNQFSIYRAVEALSLYARNRSILSMPSETIDAICRDFLSDSPNDIVQLSISAPFRMFSQYRGMGLGDSYVYSYGLHRNPLDMTDLILAQKESPFSDDYSYQQSRALAISISHEFGPDSQEIVHEQDPYAYQLVQALIDFYDTGNTEQYLSVKDKIVRIQRYTEELDEKYFLNREKYEKYVPIRNDTDNKIKAIDALRLLKESMDGTTTAVPHKTSVPELDESLETALSNTKGEGDSEIRFKKEDIMHVIGTFNSFIDTYYAGNKEGLSLYVAQFASWLERRAYTLLQEVTSFEEQQNMYKKEWFLDILRFYMSIYSAEDYDKESIDAFLGDIQKIPERNYRDAYRAIGQLVIGRVSKLSEECSKRGRVYTDSLWGGGLAYQYLSLIDEREALTEYERKYINEKRVDRRMGIDTEGLYHPGE